MSRRVVLTGMGCVSAAGLGADALRRALRVGICLAKEAQLPLSSGEQVQMPIAGCPDFDRNLFLPPARQRRMSLLSQNWVVACLQARSDAGLSATPEPERAAVSLGTGFGGLDSTVRFLDGVRADGLGLGNPFYFSESVANAPAGHAAIVLDCRGFNLTLTCGDLSGLAAVEAGAAAVRDGRADLVFAGGVEQMVAPLLTVLARLSSRSTLRRRPEALRPGTPQARLIPGEGAACFVLEEWEQARRRGVIPFAEIRAGHLVSDARTSRCRWSASPKTWMEAQRGALRASGVRPDDVDEVVLHASSDPDAEEAEERAVRDLLLAERPPRGPIPAFCRPARVLGHFAAAGAFAIAAAALSLRHQEAYGERAAGTSEPAGPAPQRPPGVGIRNVLVSAGSWGGGCAALVLARGTT